MQHSVFLEVQMIFYKIHEWKVVYFIIFPFFSLWHLRWKFYASVLGSFSVKKRNRIKSTFVSKIIFIVSFILGNFYRKMILTEKKVQRKRIFHFISQIVPQLTRWKNKKKKRKEFVSSGLEYVDNYCRCYLCWKLDEASRKKNTLLLGKPEKLRGKLGKERGIESCAVIPSGTLSSLFSFEIRETEMPKLNGSSFTLIKRYTFARANDNNNFKKITYDHCKYTFARFNFVFAGINLDF